METVRVDRAERGTPGAEGTTGEGVTGAQGLATMHCSASLHGEQLYTTSWVWTFRITSCNTVATGVVHVAMPLAESLRDFKEAIYLHTACDVSPLPCDQPCMCRIQAPAIHQTTIRLVKYISRWCQMCCDGEAGRSCVIRVRARASRLDLIGLSVRCFSAH